MGATRVSRLAKARRRGKSCSLLLLSSGNLGLLGTSDSLLLALELLQQLSSGLLPLKSSVLR